MALDDAHVWIGRFESFQRWQKYLQEHYYEDDERPLSQFAADQGQTFYDHDWIEGEFIPEPRPGSQRDQLTKLIHGFGYAQSYLEAAIADAMQAPIKGVNAAISIDAGEIPNPRSAIGDGYELHFVGKYQRTPPPPQFDPAATELSLTNQRLTEVPSAVFELTNLKELSLADNALAVIPEDIGRLQNLEKIYLYHNQLTNLPDALFMLPQLRKIMANENALQSLPESVGAAPALTGLSVQRNRLSRLPDQIGDVSSLELLDVASNALTELPSSIGQLSSLHTLRVDGNDITRLPDEIAATPMSDQLSLPQFFDMRAQSPTVQVWLGQPRRHTRPRFT